MKRQVVLAPISKFHPKKMHFLGLAFISLLLYGFGAILTPPPGIDQPTEIGAYLDDAFPHSSPSGTNENWIVENAFPNLTFADPLALIDVPGEDNYYVVGKVGVIWKISKNSSTTVKEVVLDISSRVDTDIDAGLVNAVLHPEFGQPGSPNKGYIYLYYRWNPNGNVSGCETYSFLRLSRFSLVESTGLFDPDSEFILVQTFDEHCWHNGGGMFFDDEGYLYYTAGDAGEINDPFGTTQKLDDRLMSGVFRIDVDMNPSRSHPIRRQQVDPSYNPYAFYSFSQGYFIPNDNPWQDENGGLLEEYYALGLRSPHRAAMDPETGYIWFGDVGQGAREEISVVTAPGQNFQWPFREGSIPGDFSPPNPLIGASEPPVFDYSHAVGNSIIGGFVYRGSFYQGALYGRYIFADHGVRNIWTYNPANSEVQFIANVPASGVGDKNGVSSFAVNDEGEVFVLKLYGTDLDGGVIYRLKQESTVQEPPHWLSQTGAFVDMLALTPAPGVIPYDVNAPLWSDRAAKQRWIALPNDGVHNTPAEQITFSENGNWQFPPGTVFIKHFELPVDYNNPLITKRLETRFLVITQDGGAYGVTYKWNDAGTDAELIINGEDKDFNVVLGNGSPGVQTWTFPSRTDCMTCHNSNADFVLGLHTWQLNGDLTYPSNITDNQLNTWLHLGMFANPFDPGDIPAFPKAAGLDDPTATLETKVRSYLDANCAHCHLPNGVEGAFDARFSTPIENQNIIWAFGASRNTSSEHYVIKPLDPAESEIWLRDGSLNNTAMPPLAKSLVDEQYMTVLTDWINSLEEELCWERPVSILPWQTAANGQGPIEINSSVGQEQPNDGHPITINGQVFPLGLGVHAPSEITYKVNDDYAVFESYIGVDDETCNAGAVVFEVYKDNVLAYQSPLLRQSDDALFIRVNIQGANEVKLVVTAGEFDDTACDHADWANPKFLPCLGCTVNGPCDDGDPCTVDSYDDVCNCVGVLMDSDLDGVSDGCDICPGYDDLVDSDSDTVPDGCDFCPGHNDSLDEDFDGRPDGCDICPGYDDLIDTDEDGVPDGCDYCPGYDDSIDSDSDGVPDGCDYCPGHPDQVDVDEDGTPDGCDECIGMPASSCETGDCPVNEIPIPSGTYAGSVRITSTGSVASGSSVIFLSPNVIELKPGFTVQAGGSFHAMIVDCIEQVTRPAALSKAPAAEPEVTPAASIRQATKPAEKPGRKELSVRIWPNPFQNELKLLIISPFPELKRAVVRITDISGRIIYEKYDAPFDEEIIVHPHIGWVSGVYVVHIHASDYQYTQKIIKQ